MIEQRDYIGLDWVIGEIDSTLTEARLDLEQYADSQDDLTLLDNCRTKIQQIHLNHIVLLRHTNALTELANRTGRHSSTAQSCQSWHARVIPTTHQLLVDQPVQQPFTHHRVLQTQTRKFDLGWVVIDGDIIQHPVIQRAVISKLQGAQRM